MQNFKYHIITIILSTFLLATLGGCGEEGVKAQDTLVGTDTPSPTPPPNPSPTPPSSNTAPTISLLGANPLNLNVGDTFTDPGATATDNEDGDITSSIQTSGNVNTTTAGTYTLTYAVTDSGGLSASVTRNVIVATAPPPANTPPTITLLGANPLNLNVGDTFTNPGATATDKEDGDITSSIQTSGNVNTTTAGTYTLTYAVTDSGGLSASVTRNVIVSAVVVTEVVKKTGQTVSYDESGNPASVKDDGFYKKGLAPSYTRNGDTVTDNVTGLTWSDDAESGGVHLYMLWNGTNGTAGGPAETRCANLALGGFTDWRLPEIWELLTIADKSKYDPAIDTGTFHNVSDRSVNNERLYWTKTIKQGAPVGVTTQINYSVNFLDGRDQNGLAEYVGNPKAVRCVRGTAHGTGLAPSSRNLSRDNATDVVTDNNTNLQWSDDTGTAGQSGSWQEAINYCENTLNIGGFSDWRLPNLNELYTITDNTKKPSAWAGPFQNLDPTGIYWSSTSSFQYHYTAWLMDFKYGRDTWGGKIATGTQPPAPNPGPHKVICVRNK